MADPISLEVRCRAAKGGAFAVEAVIFDYGGGTSADLDVAPYRFQVPNAMEGRVLVRKAGLDWPFPLRVTEGKDGLVMAFHESIHSPPMMATLTWVVAVSGGKKKREYLLDIAFADLREVVLLSGYDYHGGSTNITYATTHMHELWKAKSIDEYSLITVFDCDTGMRERWVKGIGPEKQAKHKFVSGWSLLEEKLTGTQPPVPVHGGGDPGSGSISITHVYGHLQECGKDRPGSVIEFSIFSHSWMGGPILFNTSEGGGYARIYARDPDDHDVRMTKDFGSVNMPPPLKDQFKAAFSSTAFIKIWGCLAVKIYRDMLNKARKAKDDVVALGIPPADRTNAHTHVVYDDNRPGILKFFREKAYKSNYMWILSQVTGLPVYGGAPGTGALLLSNGTWNWMYMPEYRLKYEGGARVEKEPYYLKELHFMRDELGWTFSDDWYLEYR